MDPERLLDPLIVTVDRALRSVFAPARAARPIPEGPAPRPASTTGPAAGGAAGAATAAASPRTAASPSTPAAPSAAAAAAADGPRVRVAGPDEAGAEAHAASKPVRPARAEARALPSLSDREKREAAALMRVNHAGEVAAQALYHGQAAFARDAQTREMLLRAARDEADHLAWCQDRLRELDSRPSLLSPVWYAGSFAIGAFAAALGDRVSLGFVAETERQVEGHIDSHLERLPPRDARSRAILEQMRADEIEHGEQAVSAGGMQLPGPVRGLMRRTARVMTFTSYWV